MDCLDVFGVIGIVCIFVYGGVKGRLMYDLIILLCEEMMKEEYRKNNDLFLNYFYEKFLKLKDLMNMNVVK